MQSITVTQVRYQAPLQEHLKGLNKKYDQEIAAIGVAGIMSVILIGFALLQTLWINTNTSPNEAAGPLATAIMFYILHAIAAAATCHKTIWRFCAVQLGSTLIYALTFYLSHHITYGW